MHKNLAVTVTCLLALLAGQGAFTGQGPDLKRGVEIKRLFTSGGCRSGCSSGCPRVKLMIDIVNLNSVRVGVTVRYETSGEWGAMGSPHWESKRAYVRLRPRERRVEEIGSQPHWLTLERAYGREKRTCRNPFRNVSLEKVQQRDRD